MSHQPSNIFAGTQIVPLVEVRGTNNLLVHPRCAPSGRKELNRDCERALAETQPRL
jgi:hypothetical protein